jgi:iron only hydrogenase large subunit-like protein
MACPGGCVAGGGQPYPPAGMHVLDPKLAKLRARRSTRSTAANRCASRTTNPAIQRLYEHFLGAPNNHLCHELLHTHYTPKLPRGVK